MDYKSWYRSHFESRLMGRYVYLKHLNSILKNSKDTVEISIAGYSELGKEIPLLKIGHGKKVVLGWSQMHGNESTTTKAIFDFLKFVSQKEYFQLEINQFLDRFSFFIIPMLNPDGSERYTRENANLVDLNRDAKNLSQSESVVLSTIFDKIKPDLCLNLHDQRSIYGFDNALSATVSFLAPSADQERSITPSRKLAMEHIVRMYGALQEFIPGMVGRYDDVFNDNCVGDTFQMKGVPTILFEAGHYKDDYNREETREFIFHAFLSLFEFDDTANFKVDYKKYFEIPENKINFKDLIIRNVKIHERPKLSDIAIQNIEVLKNESIIFEATVDAIDKMNKFYGHWEIDMNGESILIDSQEKITVGQKFSTIARKSDPSVIIFPKK